MDAAWDTIVSCLREEKPNPQTKVLATRHYNYKGTICPISLSCWRMFQAMPGSAVGVETIAHLPAIEVCMVNGEYDRRIEEDFGSRNALDASEAIDSFIDAIEYVSCQGDLTEKERARLKTKDRKHTVKILFYDKGRDDVHQPA